MTPLDRCRSDLAEAVFWTPNLTSVTVRANDLRLLIALADACRETAKVEFTFLPNESCEQWSIRTKAIWKRKRDALDALQQDKPESRPVEGIK